MDIKVSKTEQKTVVEFRLRLQPHEVDLIVNVCEKMGMLSAVKVLGLMVPNLTTIEKVDIIRKIVE